jgi:hypothetical protein
VGGVDADLADRLSGLLVLSGAASAHVLLRELLLGLLEPAAATQEPPVVSLREFVFGN